jgi:hypothetical protein
MESAIAEGSYAIGGAPPLSYQGVLSARLRGRAKLVAFTAGLALCAVIRTSQLRRGRAPRLWIGWMARPRGFLNF